jgi:hypothetical protein
MYRIVETGLMHDICVQKLVFVQIAFLLVVTPWKKEAACSSETSVYEYKTAWCHNPEDYNLNSHLHDNLKFFFIFLQNVKNFFFSLFV